MAELKDILLNKIDEGDLIHKIFLKPTELVLRTNKEDKTVSSRELPRGLMQALKINSISDNTYEPINFPTLNLKDAYEKICEDNGDNLISFLKYKPQSEDRASNGLQLGICVCMYSQNRTMLKDTIRGIEDNIAKLIQSGVNPDSIAVFVIMDGIEKVDGSVINYFEELERESFIYLGENNLPSYTKEDIEEEIKLQNRREYSFDQFVQKNINSFLFSPPQLEDRQSRRFVSVRNEYIQMKRIKEELIKLQSKNKIKENLYEKLPQRIKRDFWNDVAKQYHLRQCKKKGIIIKQSDISDVEVIELYSNNQIIGKIITNEAINKAIIFINKYIAARNDLCYLGSFRKKITLPSLQKGGRQHAFVEEDEDGMVNHMNLFMCVKYKNAGKLSSHNWFFNGFCRELNPSYTILMDVGLKPEKESIFKMYKHMKDHPNVGGVCGYMRLKIEQIQDEEQIKDEDVDWLTGFTLNFVDIQKAQQMEYNLAHIIDKPFESAFKFIHVLPGAFSGYNMAALQSQDKKGKLLKEYFRSIEEKIVENTINETQITLSSVLLRVLLPQFLYKIFIGVEPESEEEMLYNENIYFAEDRILCMQIHKNGLDLVYLPDALAEVDPIKTVHGLMGQRKRWINGSYFAFEKVKKQISKTNKCELPLRSQVLFYDFLNILVYFAPAIFFFTIHISMKAFRTDVLDQILKPVQSSSSTNQSLLDFFVYIIDLIYALILFTILYYSLNTPANRPIFKPYIYFTSTVLGLLAVSVMLVFLVDIIRGLTTGTIFLLDQGNGQQSDGFNTVLQISRWIFVGVLGIYFIPLLVYAILFRSIRPFAQAIKGAFSFIFYNPTYFIILSLYALCRMDDISWGTKGLNEQGSKQSKMQQKWRIIKLIHVCKYCLWNGIAAVLLLSYSQLFYPQFYISFVIMVLIVLTIGLKIIIGSVYLFSYKCASLCEPSQRTDGVRPKKSELIQFTSKYRPEIQRDILGRVDDLQGEIRLNNQGNRRKGVSYIVNLKSMKMNPKVNNKASKKYQDLNINRSRITKQLIQKSMQLSNRLPRMGPIMQSRIR